MFDLAIYTASSSRCALLSPEEHRTVFGSVSIPSLRLRDHRGTRRSMSFRCFPSCTSMLGPRQRSHQLLRHAATRCQISAAKLKLLHGETSFSLSTPMEETNRTSVQRLQSDIASQSIELRARVGTFSPMAQIGYSWSVTSATRAGGAEVTYGHDRKIERRLKWSRWEEEWKIGRKSWGDIWYEILKSESWL